ncbi:hypothetical protein [Stenotrophomonas maltophilia]|uniref:hypothetical protein n=1 Tax=Stenotrophomonas maltophilia TaxID=40324 RepID=UPI0039C11234
MREPLTQAQKVEIVTRVRECVKAGGDLSALADELSKRYWQHWDAILAGVEYTANIYQEQAAKDAAARAERIARLGEDLAVVEELMEKLPGVLQRLRAVEVASE